MHASRSINTSELTNTPHAGSAYSICDTTKVINTFYRATLCVPRSLLSPGVCPSVCLSVMLVYCTHTAEHIVRFFSRPGSPMITVFFT